MTVTKYLPSYACTYFSTDKIMEATYKCTNKLPMNAHIYKSR